MKSVLVAFVNLNIDIVRDRYPEQFRSDALRVRQQLLAELRVLKRFLCELRLHVLGHAHGRLYWSLHYLSPLFY